MLTLLRRVLVLLILTAYVSAVMFPIAPLASAVPGKMNIGIAHDQNAPTDQMPCNGKGMAQPCVMDFGCIFLVGLPAIPDPTLLTATAWSSVHYLGSPNALHGRSIKPAIGPPISLA